MSLSCNLLTVGVHALLTAETALWCALAGQKLWLVAGLFASWFSRDVVMRCLAAILCLWSASVREYFPQSATTVQTFAFARPVVVLGSAAAALLAVTASHDSSDSGCTAGG